MRWFPLLPYFPLKSPEVDVSVNIQMKRSAVIRLCLFFPQLSFPHQAALPSPKATKELFKKHCNKVRLDPAHADQT